MTLYYFSSDLKPANVLLKTNDGKSDWNSISIHETQVKIADYDFVRGFAKELPEETVSKSVVGTPRYMAPEIKKDYYKGSAYYTNSADVYALGVMCWEIFKGVEALRMKPLARM